MKTTTRSGLVWSKGIGGWWHITPRNRWRAVRDRRGVWHSWSLYRNGQKYAQGATFALVAGTVPKARAAEGK